MFPRFVAGSGIASIAIALGTLALFCPAAACGVTFPAKSQSSWRTAGPQFEQPVG